MLAFCLKGESVELDDAVINSLLQAVESSDTFGDLLDRLNDRAETEGSSVSARIAALMHLLRATIRAVQERQPDAVEAALTTVARATPHLSPEMLIGLLTNRQAAKPEDAAIASGIIDRIDDGTIASIVARSVTAERGASERLAQVFEALVPEAGRKGPLLDRARAEAEDTEFGSDPRFPEVWQSAAMMLNYSDKGFVSAEYARELTAARSQAIEVERLSDDPPERIAGWLATVNEPSIQHARSAVDARPHDDRDRPGELEPRRRAHRAGNRAPVAARRHDRRAAAHRGAGHARPVGRQDRCTTGRTSALDTLAQGSFARHVITQFRKAGDADVQALTRHVPDDRPAAGAALRRGPLHRGPHPHHPPHPRALDLVRRRGAARRRAA